MARRWSITEDRILSGLYPQGVPIRALARQLERSEDAVSERRRALGLPARPRSRPWTKREDELVRASAWAGVPATTLASRLGRDAEQVRRRRRALLGSSIKPRPYTPADDDAIRACWLAGEDVQRLARELGRSAGSIRLRAQALGVHRPARRRRWREYEDAAVRDGYARGLTCREIASELPGRSGAAVAARAAKLGLATYGRAWSARDDRNLRMLVSEGIELERAAQILARTPDALRARARKLGLEVPRSVRAHHSGRRWTRAEDEQLRLHAGLNPATLADLLERSPEAITQRLRRMGLREARERSPHHPVPARNGLTPGERLTLVRELRNAGPRRQLALARRLGRAPGEIRALAARYGGGPP
jgi:hypothetical protein